LENRIDTGIANENGISETTRRAFGIAAKWAGFLAIIGFIGIALMVIGSISMLAFGDTMSALTGASLDSVVLILIYLFFSALYFIPTLNLMRFSNHTKAWLNNDSTMDFEKGIGNLARMFSFIGIMTAFILGLYLLIAIGGIIAVTGG
jgi:hypothetical protein